MNLLKVAGASGIVYSKLTNQDWILILSIAITILGMIQDYLENKKNE